MTNMASTYGARASILISPPSQLAEPVYVAMVTIELGHRACMAFDSSAVNVVRPSCMPGYAGSVLPSKSMLTPSRFLFAIASIVFWTEVPVGRHCEDVVEGRLARA